MVKFTYLLINFGAFIVPFIFSFHPKLKFNKVWYAFWPANLLVACVFFLWDVAYTKMGVWGFNDNYILGFRISDLPIEEVLFFICIPYASLFTYHCFKLFFKPPGQIVVYTVSICLCIILVLMSVTSIHKLYTSVTSIALIIAIVFFTKFHKSSWLPHFYLTYLVILIPFFIVNGLLTGTGLDSPVVWYNDAENLGLRVLTIPFEDFFYGMLLLILNVFAFESFKKKYA